MSDETTAPIIETGPVLETGLSPRGVVVRFGGLVALNGVSVEAPRGRITGRAT